MFPGRVAGEWGHHEDMLGLQDKKKQVKVPPGSRLWISLQEGSGGQQPRERVGLPSPGLDSGDNGTRDRLDMLASLV